jgi:hypothetical protein
MWDSLCKVQVKMCWYTLSLLYWLWKWIIWIFICSFLIWVQKIQYLLDSHACFIFTSIGITVQQDATVFSILHTCRQLYMFRVLTPIIRSSYNCNYRFWHWSTGSAIIRSCCWAPTQQQEWMVAAPVDQCQNL